MLFEIMKYLKNFFPCKREEDSFTIENGTIGLSFVKDGQYILIEGSSFNDGVYKYPVSNLEDESFDGCITSLNPPKAFLNLCEEIQTFVSNSTKSEFQSESFGGYSYTKATNQNGSMADWHDVYKERLDVWRRL